MKEIKQFPVQIILKSGEIITSKNHELSNYYGSNVLACNSHLNNNLKPGEEAIIYIDEERGSAWTELADGTRFTSIGKNEKIW